MPEFNQLLFSQIKEDSTYQTLSGATASDPRIYKQRTPIKLPVNDSKPAYSVYYPSGTIDPGVKIHGIGKDDRVFVIESYAITDTLLPQITTRIEELFDEQKFETTSYYIGYARARKGSEGFDEGRKLFLQTITIHMKLIRSKD